MNHFLEHISSNEVRPVTVAEEIHRMTVDEYIRVVRALGWESTELIEGVVYDVTPEFNRHAETVDNVFRRVDGYFDRPELFTRLSRGRCQICTHHLSMSRSSAMTCRAL